ncbi:MAG: hypothetical protein U0559_10360 [Anaerolineae bacterium]
MSSVRLRSAPINVRPSVNGESRLVARAVVSVCRWRINNTANAAAITASARYAPRHDLPIANSTVNSSGAAATPIEPRNVQRAIVCSARSGLRSINVACERLTYAPLAKYITQKASSNAL